MAVSSRRQFSVEKGICHMSETTITQLPDPSGFSSDPFTEVLRNGARDLIEQAIHAELATLMAAFSNETLEDGRARLVRHGHLPEREVMTGIGPVPVKVPRVRDGGVGADKITFTPSILPRYLRKAKSVEELLPWLYLRRAPYSIPCRHQEPWRAGRTGVHGLHPERRPPQIHRTLQRPAPYLALNRERQPSRHFDDPAHLR